MRAYKCDDCGELEQGVAPTISGDGKPTHRLIAVPMSQYDNPNLDTLALHLCIERASGPQDTKPIELCERCRTIATLRAGLVLASERGLEVSISIGKKPLTLPKQEAK